MTKIDNKILRDDAVKAVNILLQYIGEDITREGLVDTAKRVIKSYDELFAGYKEDIAQILSKQFHEISDYNDIILLKSINFTSLCEHHMLPFYGSANVAYIPNKSVIGVSKIIRLVNAFSKRLQIQEKMTINIANSMHKYLKPQGVAVSISAEHSCMSMRGVTKNGSIMNTSHFTGIFKRLEYKRNFLQMIS